MYSYSGVFAGVTLSFCFLHEGTASFYGGDLTPCAFSENCIRIPPSECAEWQGRWGMKDPAYAEYVLSCSYACDALMRRDRIVFHGAAFRWHQRAWLFSAPSGTGKTTQLKNWQRLFGGEMEIMNGDKPILELCADGHVLVRPSPWKGKEGLGRDDITAPLGGIILLRQDRENRIARATPGQAARSLFGRNYSSFADEEDVLNAARILEGILRVTPVWILRNLGDEDSARLTYRTLCREGF